MVRLCGGGAGWRTGIVANEMPPQCARGDSGSGVDNALPISSDAVANQGLKRCKFKSQLVEHEVYTRNDICMPECAWAGPVARRFANVVHQAPDTRGHHQPCRYGLGRHIG